MTSGLTPSRRAASAMLSSPSACGGGVGVAVLMGGAGGAVAAGGLDLGREGNGPPARGAAAGVQVAGVDPVVDGAGGHAGALGDLAGAELAVCRGRGCGGSCAGC